MAIRVKVLLPDRACITAAAFFGHYFAAEGMHNV